MNIVSNRVVDTDPHSNTTLRLESALEAGLVALFKVQPGVIAVMAQYQVEICIDGIWHTYWFDICVDFENGCRAFYAVRNEENAEEVELLVELFRNQELKNHGHFAFVMTEEDISKPAIYRAEQIVQARRKDNKRNNGLVYQTLMQAGGRERLGNVFLAIQEIIPPSVAWDAVWSLIDQGVICHDHPDAHNLFLKNHSWIRVVGRENDEEE
ncbi:hypothetical protein [Rhizobium ruizarguesonis]|nr:hypothetical protein [Rhizobium ruizarguesonis]